MNRINLPYYRLEVL